MNETAERARVTRPRKRAATLSVAEQELKVIKAYAKKISSSKKDSIAFLQRAGILDRKGDLAKPYRS
jgi:hypothetical protein